MWDRNRGMTRPRTILMKIANKEVRYIFKWRTTSVFNVLKCCMTTTRTYTINNSDNNSDNNDTTKNKKSIQEIDPPSADPICTKGIYLSIYMIELYYYLCNDF